VRVCVRVCICVRMCVCCVHDLDVGVDDVDLDDLLQEGSDDAESADVLQCVAVCCRVLQSVAEYCSVF